MELTHEELIGVKVKMAELYEMGVISVERYEIHLTPMLFLKMSEGHQVDCNREYHGIFLYFCHNEHKFITLLTEDSLHWARKESA